MSSNLAAPAEITQEFGTRTRRTKLAKAGVRPASTKAQALKFAGAIEARLAVIRVRYSCDGPLKEDKHGTFKVKHVPAPADAIDHLGMWLRRRKLAGAGGENLVLVSTEPPRRARTLDWQGFRKEQIGDWWDRAKAAVNATLDEVSAAVGHSSPVITKQHYAHFARRSPELTRRLGG